MSSLRALPRPLPGASDPLGGGDYLPCASSPDGMTKGDRVKPRKGRVLRLGDGVLTLAPYWRCQPPQAPGPLLGLLGVETLGDPACTSRLPAAVGRRCAEGWLRSPCPPPPPPLRGCLLAALLCFRPLPRVDAPALESIVLPLWPPLPRPISNRWRRRGVWGRRKSRGGGAGRPLLGSRSGSRVARKGGGGRDPLAVIPLLPTCLPCGTSIGTRSRPRGPPATRASGPCPAPSGCLVHGPQVKVVTARSGSPIHSAAGASHACLWPWRPAPPAVASACLAA